jgi:hypothetical protein
MIEKRNQGIEESGNQGKDNLNPGILDSSNPVFSSPDLLWRSTSLRTALLTGVCLLPLLILRKWQIAAGVFAGSVLLLGDIYALKAPLDMMVRRTATGKRAWVFALGLLRIVVLAGVLFVLVKYRVASILGMFIGVTLPVVAMVSAVIIKPQATSRKLQATSHKLGS